MVPTRTAVRAVHDCVVELGNEVLHIPREFSKYPPPYFATFWIDPSVHARGGLPPRPGLTEKRPPGGSATGLTVTPPG